MYQKLRVILKPIFGKNNRLQFFFKNSIVFKMLITLKLFAKNSSSCNMLRNHIKDTSNKLKIKLLQYLLSLLGLSKVEQVAVVL